MSGVDLTPGDGLLLRSFVDHPADTVKLSYGAPRGKRHYHLALWLGIWTEGDAGVDERLNHLGWVFDKERAAQAIEAQRAETGTGSVHESAVPTGDAPDTDTHPNEPVLTSEGEN